MNNVWKPLYNSDIFVFMALSSYHINLNFRKKNQIREFFSPSILKQILLHSYSQNNIELLNLRHAGKELGNMFFVVIFLPLSQRLCD